MQVWLKAHMHTHTRARVRTPSAWLPCPGELRMPVCPLDEPSFPDLGLPPREGHGSRGFWAAQKEAPKAVLWGLSHPQPPIFKAMMANWFLF